MTDPKPQPMKKVVIVEDDHYVLEFIRFTLEQQNYEVYAAADGMEGLDTIRKHLPGVVILDLMLPKMDGFTVLKKMEEDPKTSGIPVLVMSAYTTGESMRQLIQSQKSVKDVFTKPVRSKEFLAKVKELLGDA